ncbi:hypothetical protein GJ633_06895 [Halorubrum sp. CBA1125]|uniref:CheF family chemotaxis protein n=1 Tax=Halorubrum sp. CBA1125 TaxID=2668072 RepID=UPI0012E71630|nr:CheF family chemotaxis protein [Halorubrum sp. CBA1125]MUW14423.1 hypothetical protein [Halorubrum sp. CBA1125]
MGESVVADFLGRVYAPDLGCDEPVPGRVLLSQRRLVLATDETKTTIPLSSVFDVVAGQVPGDLRSFFSDSVTVAFERDGSRRAALVEGDTAEVDRFVRQLFTALVADVRVTVRHPATVDGRVTDASDHTATVSLSTGAIRFEDRPDPFSVELSSVVDSERTRRTVAGAERPALVFRHVPDARTVTSVVTVPDERVLTLLGRYVELAYEDVKAEVESFDPTEEQLEVLGSIYSAGGEASVADVVTGDVTHTSMVLDTLREADLVVDGDEGTALTRKGQLVVTAHLESPDA